MIPSFRSVRTQIKELQRLQDVLGKIFNSILAKQILDGRLIEDLELVSGSVNTINHGLGKPIRGFFVVRTNADSRLYEAASDTPNISFALNATANVTVSLWVF